jgi:hypothetical protein
MLIIGHVANARVTRPFSLSNPAQMINIAPNAGAAAR